MTRPLLLIDVDGPLNPYAQSERKKARDKVFTRYLMLCYKVWLRRWHGEELLKLAEVYDLVWCTTWEHNANKLIGPKIGLPDLPVIEFPAPPSKPDARLYFKTPTVVEYAAGRPFAWIDDEVTHWDVDYVGVCHDGPSFLLPVDPATGLLQDHFDRLAAWAASLLKDGTCPSADAFSASSPSPDDSSQAPPT